MKTIRAEPYGWRVRVFRDREQWARVTARNGFGSLRDRRIEASDCGGITSTDCETKRAYVGIFEESVNTLSHEMTHVALEILSNAGVRFTPTNNEAIAYLVGYLTGEGERAMKRAQ